MKILFIHHNDKERQIYTIYLENIFPRSEVLQAPSYEKAYELLGKDYRDWGKIDFVLFTNKSGTPQEVADFYKEVRERAPMVPFILLSEDHPESIEGMAGFRTHNPKNGYIKYPLSPADFRTSILSIVNPSLFGSAHSVPAFQRVRLIHFFRFNKVLCDVYIKLSDNKYVKVLHKETQYHRNDVDKFRIRGLDYLYVRNDDFEKFHVSFNKTPFLIMDTEGMNENDVEEAITTTHIVMQDLITHMGFTPEIVQVASKSVDEITKLSIDHNTIGHILYRARQNIDYIYDHSYLTAIVCCEILHNMRWGNERSINNLCMAALFHDMTQDNPELAMVRSQYDPKLENYSPFEVKNYLNHPMEVVEMLNKVEFVPMEVKTVIQNHHEWPDGKGFPQHLHPARLSSIVCAFIVAHEYVRSLYDIEFDPSREFEIFERMRKTFDVGNFKSPMLAFLRVHTKLPHNQGKANWSGLDEGAEEALAATEKENRDNVAV